MQKIWLRLAVVLFWMSSASSFATGPSFHADADPRIDHLTQWRSLGGAEWSVEKGAIAGRAAETGGWLVLSHSYQDVDLYSEFKCEGGCETGVLLRAQRGKDGSLSGIYVSLSDAVPTAYRVMTDAKGKITERSLLPRGGGLVRVAPTPAPSMPTRSAVRTAPPVDLPLLPPDTRLRAGDWNEIEMFLDANIVRAFLNNGHENGAVGREGYGPIALYLGPKGSVAFRHLALRDASLKITQSERVSPHFRKQRLSDFYYSWGAAAADFNHDGKMDVVAGPYIYYGPDYLSSREIYLAQASNPTTEFATEGTMQYAADFTGDGWPDVISVMFGGGPGVQLYVNPGNENRRWDRYTVVDHVQSEIAVLRDLDGDGKPELVYSGEGCVRYAKPDPANPTGPWIVHTVSEKGYGAAHGIGVGDVDGDGRLDILNAYGWWRQPAEKTGTWSYHPAAFGQYTRGIMGGSVMAVYDVNGDGHNDVVTSLDAHGFGLAWFEQKRDEQGLISFVEHMVMNDFSTKNAGGVTFTELHGSTFADVDGDGIMDFVIGKRYFSHLDTNIDPDPRGAPVLYWYKTVRDRNAPGGAKLVPELIDNHSGAGSDVLAFDLNHDGAVDVVTATRFGTFIYWGERKGNR